jgi:uncharacterized protein with PIN domain
MPATFRFYEELNDFLPKNHRKRAFEYRFNGTPSVKDAIEALGVPHTEVDLVLVDGESVGFDYRLGGGERVAVYPVFESLDIAPLTHLRPRPLRHPRFVLDVHLGALARGLRMLGFDSLYHNDFTDETIIAISIAERRIILTRDVGILKHGSVTHGYWLRATLPERQLREVADRFDLYGRIAPFRRCMVCNAPIAPVDKEAVLDTLPPRIARAHQRFFRCRGCGKVYWKGSHYERMLRKIERLRSAHAHR